MQGWIIKAIALGSLAFTFGGIAHLLSQGAYGWATLWGVFAILNVVLCITTLEEY